jgi:hypothetical protein
MKYLLFAALVALPCCADFATPAELETTQILAIQSNPASLTLGSSATLTIFVADENGPVADPDVAWSLPSQAGVPDLGTIEDDGTTVTYTAPAALPELPFLVTVEARLADGENTLVALKAMLIGGPALTNPEIAAIRVDGETAAEPLTLQVGAESSLAVELATPPSEDATYAWYARPGTIDEYRSSPTVYLAPDEPGEGWLIVVVRDRGGIAYQSIAIRVE